MKKLYLIILSVFALLNTAVAQKLSVESFVLAPTDLSAQTEGRKDMNGDACALVKISFVGDVADVEGNVIKPLVKRNNETWAFMTQESRQMKVVTKNYLPLMVIFGDYGIDKLQSNRTYVLTMAKSRGASETQQMQTLTIKYSPSSAMVLVDNKLVRGSKGVAKTTLPIGQHSYIIACDGYESEEGMVKLKPTAPSNLQIALSKEVAFENSSVQSELPHQKKIQQSMAQSVSSSVSLPNSISAIQSVEGTSTSISEVIKIPVNNGISIEMVKVEAGSFNMGATPEMRKPNDDEKPVHRVTLTYNYYLGKYEVTQALWQTVMGRNPSKFVGEKLPVESVSWNDCQEFISKLNRLTGKQFRLPTEAEWEFAARGGKMSRGYQFRGSNILIDVAWCKKNSKSKTHVVGTKLPNELGIYDMSGNVYEWCQDWKELYGSSPLTNPVGPDCGLYRIYRGGSWSEGIEECRLSYRGSITSSYVDKDRGLRLALSE